MSKHQMVIYVNHVDTNYIQIKDSAKELVGQTLTVIAERDNDGDTIVSFKDNPELLKYRSEEGCDTTCLLFLGAYAFPNPEFNILMEKPCE